MEISKCCSLHNIICNNSYTSSQFNLMFVTVASSWSQMLLMMPRKHSSSELAYTKNIGNWRDPLFNSSHVLIDPGQQKSPQWQYYTVTNVPVVSASPYPAIVSVIRPQMQWQRYYDEAVNNYTNDTSNASSANSYSEGDSFKHQCEYDGEQRIFIYFIYL